MHSNTFLKALIGSYLAVVPLACTSGSGDSSPPPPPVPPANVQGSWTITENVSGNCPGLPITESYTVQVSQNGSAISVTTPDGTFQGRVDGSQLSWTGSYPEDGGTTTVTGMNLTVNGSSLSGSATWSWTDGSDSCSGQTSITGTRFSADSNKSSQADLLNAIAGCWKLRTEVVRVAGEYPGELGDTDSRDVTIVVAARSAVIFGLVADVVPLHVDGDAQQIVCSATSARSESDEVRECFSMTVEATGDSWSLIGLCEWQYLRNGQVLAEGTSIVDGERAGWRSAVVGNRR